MPLWNLWHGCHKTSPGCLNCYVYRGDTKRGKDASLIYKTEKFLDPIKRTKNGEYKIPSGSLIYTCFTSDFFLEDADEWRPDAWEIIAQRSDCQFLFLTKRIHRFYDCIPDDWGDGYDNVTICCTCENQKTADFRLPIFVNAPIKHKGITYAPILGPIDIAKYLSPSIEIVTADGESGNEARLCDYDWVLSLRNQCANAGVNFIFRQTGSNFKKDSKIYNIPRRMQFSQAKKANINIPKNLNINSL